MIKSVLSLVAAILVMLVTGCASNGTTHQPQPPQQQQQTEPSQNQTQSSNPSPPSQGSTKPDGGVTEPAIGQPVSIAFWNTQLGLLVSSSNGHGLVWKTTDGGHSWTKVYENEHRLNRVMLTGVSSAKVLAGEDWKNPNSQIVTEDQGRTWVQQKYQKPSFADQACSMGTSGEDLFVNHSAPSSDQVWVLCNGQPATVQMAKLIVSSADGGKTWTKQAEAIPKDQSNDGLSLSGHSMGIDFLSDGKGWLWESRGYSYYTNDGGKHWMPFTNLTQPETREARSMSLIDDQHGYALLWNGNQYQLMFTTDGGKSWIDVKSWPSQ